MSGALVALLAFTLSGCQVASVGHSAVAVDEEGNLLGVVAVCQGSIQGVGLERRGGSVADGEWRHVGALEEPAVFSLVAPGAQWETEIAFDGYLESATEYKLYGWTDDNSASTDGMHFTRSDIEGLEPWTVLFSGENETVDHFLEHACDRWG